MARRGVAPLLSPLPATAAAYLSTLEVRWIFPGRRPASTTRWFARFPGTTEERQDRYLVHPHQGGISVKVRGSSLLELKIQEDDDRVLGVPGLGAARVKACEKWSFLLAVADGRVPAGGSWKQVGKSRRLCRFAATGEPIGPDALNGTRAACEAELTDIRVDGQAWWTLGLEAGGSGPQVWETLQAAARALFALPLPGPRPADAEATTYSEWLQGLPAFS